MKIVCIGDSLTEGYGVGRSENWVALLNASSAHDFVNKGISGDTSGGMLARFRHDVVAEKPQYAIIMGGANDFVMGDSLGSVRANIMAMVHQAYHHRIIPVLGTGVKADAERFRKDWAAITDVGRLIAMTTEYRDWVLEFCSVFTTSHIDFYAEFEKRTGSGSYLFDGLHPSKEGHKILADIAREGLLGISFALTV
jgi:lysophospholipase L1-like esterase